MNDQKLKNVFKLDANERYGYLIRKVADFGQIFLIADQNGDYVTCGTAGSESIPVWPEMEFANQFLDSAWKDFKIVRRELNPFLDWLDKLEKENFHIGAFPNTEFNAIVVKPTEMKKHLILECQQYE